MNKVFYPQGVCSRRIDIEIENGIIEKISFTGGCNGNLKGISALAAGHKPEEVISLLKGIKCGFKNTSCPDQLAVALEEVLKENKDV